MQKQLRAVVLLTLFTSTASFSFAQSQPANSLQSQSVLLSPKEVYDRFSSRVVLLQSTTANGGRVIASGLMLAPGEGYIATNAHAIEDSEAVYATLNRGNTPTTSRATLLYFNSQLDIAILKTELSGPAFDTSATPQSPSPGEKIFAIGNPRGLQGTITEGIVSGIRETSDGELIQHSASVSPGSSGGALIDEHGVLVGMNTLLLRDSQNLNFAIPTRYIATALLKAASNATPLAFPHKDSKVVSEGEALEAFASRDYIRAIDLAQAELATSRDRFGSYYIIGVSYYHLGRVNDAELYLNQVLAGLREDNSVTHDTRMYLIMIRHKRYAANPTMGEAASLNVLLRDYLKSPDPITPSEDENQFRAWATDLVAQLNDLSGDWLDKTGTMYAVFVSNDFRLNERSYGRYSVSLIPRKSSQTGEFGYGILAVQSDGSISGTLQIGATIGTLQTTWKQQIEVELQLSGDLTHLTGTVTYLKGQGAGEPDIIDFYQQLLPPRTLPVTMVRR